MFTIKRAVELTGVAAGTLRAWERRYGIGSPRRTEAGYRLYDQAAITEIQSMQRLVTKGWSHVEAAAEVVRLRESGGPAVAAMSADSATQLTESFLDAARALDEEALNRALDEAFGRASFEYVIDSWLAGTMRKLGEEWLAGRMDIASEHFASGAIMRRLGAAFDSAASGSGARQLLVGTPTGCYHEMGALALAAAMRRRGIGVVYLGKDVPAMTWVDSLQRGGAMGVAISVATPQDVPAAQVTVDSIKAHSASAVVAVGGGAAGIISGADLVLAGGIAESARALAEMLSQRPRG